MGGRGASSGVSKKGNPYGSQYHFLMTVGNIKFVSKNSRQSEPLMETRTRGRVYAHVEGDEIKSIVYFDDGNKRNRQIDMGHAHLGAIPHVHDGYFHSEFRKGLTPDERRMVDSVLNEWHKYRQRRK